MLSNKHTTAFAITGRGGKPSSLVDMLEKKDETSVVPAASGALTENAMTGCQQIMTWWQRIKGGAISWNGS
jgi:hypothetical protein